MHATAVTRSAGYGLSLLFLRLHLRLPINAGMFKSDCDYAALSQIQLRLNFSDDGYKFL